MKCYYHNDLDGRCAGSIVAQFTGDYNKENYIEVDYVTPIDISKVKDNEDVYFVDYCFKLTEVINLEKLDWLTQKCNVIWIDHHTDSITMDKQFTWMRNIKGVRKEGLSGAALTYMYLYNKSFDDLPYYIKLVSDYDCWKFEYGSDTTNFKLGIETTNYDATDSIWINLYNKDTVIFEELLHKGRIIQEYVDKDNLQYCSKWSYETMINGLKCLVVNRRSNSSIFGEKYNQYPVVMTWGFNGNKYVYSIFSGDVNVDCSKIASQYGGGGHKGAAGFSSDELLFKNI